MDLRKLERKECPSLYQLRGLTISWPNMDAFLEIFNALKLQIISSMLRHFFKITPKLVQILCSRYYLKAVLKNATNLTLLNLETRVVSLALRSKFGIECKKQNLSWLNPQRKGFPSASSAKELINVFAQEALDFLVNHIVFCAC